ncbi:MAG: class I SAM-dependent methyltransferase [Ferrovibrio sp.]|uniref:class I SAM-dependent methyltransferase n=1 Tax=Ferrovibrio sp. TaxID=1917215 RepID=UPI00260B0955|nr:class I SAM-dependent methyltransferase [Ferrovibrio sp.]MCW0233207.1 class I SAM-dependent methyltransferase [Ferrovibrio sp.]
MWSQTYFFYDLKHSSAESHPNPQTSGYNMFRHDIVNALLDLTNDRRYLEIGVNRGETFHNIRASHKVAVDPKFLFDVSEAISANPEAEYHETTSDDYFENVAASTDTFDVVFLDGLHTFEQTLRDFNNAQFLLSNDGIILVDDVLPSGFQSAIRDIPKWQKVRAALNIQDKSWMGDVYKLVFYIASYVPAFSFATIANNHGQTVLWRQQRAHDPLNDTLMEPLVRMNYDDLILHKSTMRRMPLNSIIDEIATYRKGKQVSTTEIDLNGT